MTPLSPVPGSRSGWGSGTNWDKLSHKIHAENVLESCWFFVRMDETLLLI